jgi:hypothetical protein
MFGRSKLIRQAIDEASAPILARIAEAERLLEMQAELIRSRAALLAIETEGRTLKFVFVRDGKMITVETMSLLSADVPGWRRDLLEPLP